MDGILDTVFGNILIILAIVGGIAGFLKDRSSKGNEKNNPYSASNPKPSSTPSGGYSGSYDESTKERQDHETMSVDNQSTHHAIDNGKHDAIPRKKSVTPSYNSHKNNRLKKQVSNNLSKQGLVNGVIMSEVLGAPRAKKPYKSIASERRR
ncbi:hypothetical protein [Virgibacillus sp. DJP39]|uniref:hypothetical protein n=1 Tax=Virgibacillus sp. DJP39 TaxID=3409790 RepID=UPI003BB51D12